MPLFLVEINLSEYLLILFIPYFSLCQDFPDDPTGKFDEFKDFVRLNFGICKWVVSITLASQV